MAAPDDLRLTDYDLKPVTRNPKLAILDFGLGTSGYLGKCDNSMPDPGHSGLKKIRGVIGSWDEDWTDPSRLSKKEYRPIQEQEYI
jgi:hypothetical protein